MLSGSCLSLISPWRIIEYSLPSLVKFVTLLDPKIVSMVLPISSVETPRSAAFFWSILTFNWGLFRSKSSSIEVSPGFFLASFLMISFHSISWSYVFPKITNCTGLSIPPVLIPWGIIGKANTPGTFEIFPKDSLIIWTPWRSLFFQGSSSTIIKPLFTCFADLPNPGTLIINFLYSPLPTLGNKRPSISSALSFVKLKPEPWGAFTITKNAPLSSGAINSFFVKLKKNRVKANVANRKIVIVVLFLIQPSKDTLYK